MTDLIDDCVNDLVKNFTTSLSEQLLVLRDMILEVQPGDAEEDERLWKAHHLAVARLRQLSRSATDLAIESVDSPPEAGATLPGYPKPLPPQIQGDPSGDRYAITNTSSRPITVLNCHMEPGDTICTVYLTDEVIAADPIVEALVVQGHIILAKV